MVLAVTIERYVGMCHTTHTKLKHQYYTLTVVIFSVITNIPKFFEFKKHLLETEHKNDTLAVNRTEENEDMPLVYLYQTSPLGEDPNFYLSNAVHELCAIGFCLLVICYCNYRVWLQIVKSTIFKKYR